MDHGTELTNSLKTFLDSNKSQEDKDILRQELLALFASVGEDIYREENPLLVRSYIQVDFGKCIGQKAHDCITIRISAIYPLRYEIGEMVQKSCKILENKIVDYDTLPFHDSFEGEHMIMISYI